MAEWCRALHHKVMKWFSMCFAGMSLVLPNPVVLWPHLDCMHSQDGVEMSLAVYCNQGLCMFETTTATAGHQGPATRVRHLLGGPKSELLIDPGQGGQLR